MKVSAQYAEEHFADLVSAFDSGEEVRIARPDKPGIRLVADEAIAPRQGVFAPNYGARGKVKSLFPRTRSGRPWTRKSKTKCSMARSSRMITNENARDRGSLALHS
jgi:antitoxin (DNA-binding transcriptional repressor) of toxin-antitoxin stability system